MQETCSLVIGPTDEKIQNTIYTQGECLVHFLISSLYVFPPSTNLRLVFLYALNSIYLMYLNYLGLYLGMKFRMVYGIYSLPLINIKI